MIKINNAAKCHQVKLLVQNRGRLNWGQRIHPYKFVECCMDWSAGTSSLISLSLSPKITEKPNFLDMWTEQLEVHCQPSTIQSVVVTRSQLIQHSTTLPLLQRPKRQYQKLLMLKLFQLRFINPKIPLKIQKL